MIPYDHLGQVNAVFHQEFEERFAAFLKKGWYILGEEVTAFEKAFAAYHHMPFCIGVGNGLDALILSLKALDFPDGSEIIVPSNTYIASIFAILNAGLKPVLVEPDIRTYNIDPSLIEGAITKATRGIMVVHLYGKCCDMDPIQAIAGKYELAIIEDCAQSHDARYKNRLAGTFGVAAGFSFYPSKNLGALGDAGAVVCYDAGFAETVKQLRNYGSHIKYYNERVGSNSRLDALQAMFLSIKLPYLEKITEHKRKLAGLYQEQLKADFIKPVMDPGFFDVYHIYAIRHPRRDALRQFLLSNEIGSEIHYPLAPARQEAVKDLFAGKSFPIADEIHNTVLSLPCSFCHTESDIEKVIGVLNRF
jgi:dTDP-4-amino-4,6-dideoxygalactose transaminase